MENSSNNNKRSGRETRRSPRGYVMATRDNALPLSLIPLPQFSSPSLLFLWDGGIALELKTISFF